MEEKFSVKRLVFSWLRVERMVLIFILVSLIRDDFQSQYADKASIVLIAHFVVIVVCCFADCIKKKLENSDIKIGNLEIDDNRK